jgi:hypothetical protein
VGEAQPAAGQVPVTSELTGRHFALASPVTATVLGALVLLLTAAFVPLAGLAHQLTIFSVGQSILISFINAGVGVVVARRQPRNPIGWILVIFVLLTTLGNGAGYYAVLAYRLGHRGLPLAPVAVLLEPMYLLGIALFPLVILLFPDGRLPRRWRWVLWAYAGLITCAMIATFVPTVAAVAGQHIRLDTSGEVTGANGPQGWLGAVILPSILAFWLSFVARQVLSWWRATDERRQQLKWLASGAAISLACFVVAVALGSKSDVAHVLFAGTVALPVSIGVGILKYRLYEIDRIISRTLAYAVVTGLLVGVYAGLVLLATRVLPLTSSVAVAASTLAAAALFSPLRRWVQRIVDRRFNRARYDADKTVAAFAARLQDAVDLDSVQDDLAGVVHQALEPAHVSVWISQRG